MVNVNQNHTQRVRGIFARIAPRYDLMNRLMTWGRDLAWRKEAVERLSLSGGGWVLDSGAGTGDISREVLAQQPDCRVVASDLTLEMLRIGQARVEEGVNPGIFWVVADAQNLPFAAEAFEGVICGYLLRNVADLERTLQEEHRVLKDGSRMVSLDTTPPQNNLLKPFITFYLQQVIPRLGRWITGEVEAYAYLPDSTERFLPAEKLAQRILSAGFMGVGFVRRMCDTMAIHWGVKARAER